MNGTGPFGESYEVTTLEAGEELEIVTFIGNKNSQNGSVYSVRGSKYGVCVCEEASIGLANCRFRRESTEL